MSFLPYVPNASSVVNTTSNKNKNGALSGETEMLIYNGFLASPDESLGQIISHVANIIFGDAVWRVETFNDECNAGK